MGREACIVICFCQRSVLSRSEMSLDGPLDFFYSFLFFKSVGFNWTGSVRGSAAVIYF